MMKSLETPSFDISKVSKIELASSVHGPVTKYANTNSFRARSCRLSSINAGQGHIPLDPLAPFLCL